RLHRRRELMDQEAHKTHIKSRTTIIIAHRLSTIAHVDQIITLKNGKIDEIGSPAKLAKSGGIYSDLLNLQQGGDSESAKKKLSSYELS
nr:ABC transporter ATP-binding protein [bacterium]